MHRSQSFAVSHATDPNRFSFLLGTLSVFAPLAIFIATLLPCRAAEPYSIDGVNQHRASSSPEYMTVVGDRVFFAAEDPPWLFVGGPEPAAPGPTGLPCESDPDPPGLPGDLGCESYSHCL